MTTARGHDDHEPTDDTSVLHARAARLFTPLAGEPSPFEPGPPRPLYGTQVPLVGIADEAQLAERVLERCAPWFHIQREVPGTHPTGSRCRIDAVLTPKDAHAWKNPEVALGVEFKSWDSHIADPSRKDTTGWVAQAIDYSLTSWKGFGRMPVFMCPDPFHRHRTDVSGDVTPVATFVDGLLGKYQVGYLALFNGVGLTLLLQGHHMIWSERYGVSNGRNWALRPRHGHRN